MVTLGLDIGGATLKAADAAGRAQSLPFELWKDPAALAGRLKELASPFAASRIAVTMTGELCDVFLSRQVGVARILDAVAVAFPGKPLHVWRTDGAFSSTEDARRDWNLTASANWLATATFATRFIEASHALLIDIGSTTADFVPLRDSTPSPQAHNDRERLIAGELVYVGCWRTPVCAVIDTVTLGRRTHRLMKEFFASVADAFLILGWMSPSPNRSTADGRPADARHARFRLARMIGADDLTEEEAYRFADAIAEEVFARLTPALLEVARRSLDFSVGEVVLAGEGEFLGRRLLERCAATDAARIISLSDKLGPETSSAACAHAVAVLLEESQGAG